MKKAGNLFQFVSQLCCECVMMNSPFVLSALGEIVRKELDTTIALCGERLFSNVGPHNLYSA